MKKKKSCFFLRQKHDLVFKLCLNGVAYFEGPTGSWCVNVISWDFSVNDQKQLTVIFFSFPPSFSVYHFVTCFRSRFSSILLLRLSSCLKFSLNFPSHRPRLDPTVLCLPSAAKYLGHSPRFPAGSSRTSTASRLCCSWGGKPGRTRSQSSWRIAPESRLPWGRSACPDPPERHISDSGYLLLYIVQLANLPRCSMLSCLHYTLTKWVKSRFAPRCWQLLLWGKWGKGKWCGCLCDICAINNTTKKGGSCLFPHQTSNRDDRSPHMSLRIFCWMGSQLNTELKFSC